MAYILILSLTLVTLAAAAPVKKRGAMSYVVGRGCPYLTHYVRDNYFNYIPGLDETPPPTTTPSGHVNWVTYTYDKGVANYVPMELIHGLINCGREYALYGVSSPEWLNSLLKTDFSIIPGVGK